MRQLKFRAFYKEYGDPKKPHGTMFYDVAPCSSDFTTWLISFDADGRYDGDFVVGKDIEVMQFTGLKDKNGTEIYEGDVVEFASFGGQYAVEYKDALVGFFPTEMARHKCEVIGNIYESPELLKV